MDVHQDCVLVLLSLAIVTLLPCSVAHRIGARASESCYEHEVEHINPENPPSSKQGCVGQCMYNFDLIARLNGTQELPLNGNLTCGEYYKCESSILE